MDVIWGRLLQDEQLFKPPANNNRCIHAAVVDTGECLGVKGSVCEGLERRTQCQPCAMRVDLLGVEILIMTQECFTSLGRNNCSGVQVFGSWRCRKNTASPPNTETNIVMRPWNPCLNSYERARCRFNLLIFAIASIVSMHVQLDGSCRSAELMTSATRN